MPNPNTYCGLCGGKGRLTKTLCCGQTICDDYGKYQPFSFSGASCARNHQRYTLCAAHSNEPGCSGSWKKCQKCKDRHAHLLEKSVVLLFHLIWKHVSHVK